MSDRIELKKAKKLKGRIIPPPDKSISHRAIMLAAIAKGKSIVKDFLTAEDPIGTMNAFRKLGIKIEEVRSQKSEVRSKNSELSTQNSKLVIHGKGIHGLKEPEDIIDCGNSGTTVRLLSGILAGNPFFSVLTGDNSLKQRPMARVINPLKEMGAEISARDSDKYLPIAIKGRKLKAIDYTMPVASAQVKSCLMLAGLYADGITTITEPQKSRDHTERMLKSMGADIETDGLKVRVKGLGGPGGKELNPVDITVPADFSSAAFFIVAALLVESSDVMIKNVGINPTRTGLLDVLRSMGAEIRLLNTRDVSGEPVADIHCKGASGLRAVNITQENIPALIDEFPILCIAAAKADGITTIRGAEELRVKESDRIKAMASGLRKMGAEVEEFRDGLSIKGNARLKGAVIESYGDHRIAMAFSIAALVAGGTTKINGISAVNISFPGFYKMLKGLTK
ncbi:MAG: 3-phosphoshikimate 1-carboxyvinyltransferase [Nitrospirae bacterium]|nr:3-phosphoshikimate 1-carboxyvinyltransferase [Nitrospirota bacterium]